MRITFQWNYFEIKSLAWEDMLFKDFSIFSSGGHLAQWSGTILAILVQSQEINISVKIF